MPRGGGSKGQDYARGLLTDEAHATQFNNALMSQYGIHSNAQEMIDAHKDSVDPAVEVASMLQEDPEETDKARKDLAATAKKFDLDADEELVGATVRGNAVVGVIENQVTGHTYKRVAAWNEAYKPPKLTPAQRARLVEQEAATLQAREIEALRREADAKLARARDEITTELGQDIQSLKERLAEREQELLAEISKAREATERATRAADSASRRRSSSRTTKKTTRSRASAKAKPESSPEPQNAEKGGPGRVASQTEDPDPTRVPGTVAPRSDAPHPEGPPAGPDGQRD